jgi:hypothetical protein
MLPRQVLAPELLAGQPLPVRHTAWSAPELLAFSDTLAFIRQQRWPLPLSSLSPSPPDLVEIPGSLFNRLAATLAYAA